MKLISPSLVPVVARATLKRAAIIVLLGSGFVLQSAASVEEKSEEETGIHPYASAGMAWDTNLFRVENSAEAQDQLGASSMSDRYATLGAGVKTVLAVSRQRFLINGRVYNYNYDRFTTLDHTGGEAQALWEWVRGDLWSGNLGYAFNRRLRSFAYTTDTQKDLRTENNVFGKADRWLTDRWRLGVLGNWSNIAFDESNSLDRNKQLGGIGIDYVTLLGNSVGFQSAITNADYYNKHSNDYKEYTVGPTADWQVAGKTRLRAEANYISRKYDDNSAAGQEDVNGFAGRLTAIWIPGESNSIRAAVYRKITNFGDEVESYAVVHGVSIEPTWQVTSKTTLRALVDSERRDYKGNTSPQREDDLNSVGVWLDWKLYRNVGLSLGYTEENRTSNRANEGYDFRNMQVQLVAGF